VDYILAGIAPELSECTERQDDLPGTAIAAVECQVDSNVVDSVGFYLFADDDDMLDAYFGRLASNGVAPDTNLRWTVANGPTYIGVLGQSDDISALMEWASDTPVGTRLWSCACQDAT